MKLSIVLLGVFLVSLGSSLANIHPVFALVSFLGGAAVGVGAFLEND